MPPGHHSHCSQPLAITLSGLAPLAVIKQICLFFMQREQMKSEAEKPIFENLDPIQMWEDIDQLELITEQNLRIVVVFTQWDCRRCGNGNTVFHAAALNPDPDTTFGVTRLMYWPDILQQIDAARERLGLNRMGVIKPRQLETAVDSYVSQGCAACDAIYGELHRMRDWERLMHAGVIGDRKYERKMSPTWPPDGFYKALEEMKKTRAEAEDDDE